MYMYKRGDGLRHFIGNWSLARLISIAFIRKKGVDIILNIFSTVSDPSKSLKK